MKKENEQLDIEKDALRAVNWAYKCAGNKENEMGVWSVLVEYYDGSDTFVFKTKAEAVKWAESALEVKSADISVYHVHFIPFRTFKESMDKFAESYAREDGEYPGKDEEDSDEDTDEDTDEDEEDPDRCVKCDRTFNQRKTIFNDGDCAKAWELHCDIGDDAGDLCAACLQKWEDDTSTESQSLVRLT